jgi:chemotaxis protein CheC
MTETETALDELEQDALTELVNIGVSRAAAALRKMVGQHVLLSVPSVEVVSRKTATVLIAQRESDDLVAVSQDFAGAISGRALLIFPLANSLELVRAVVSDHVEAGDLADMEQEALAEIGNVILNSCLATMANLLQESLNISLPKVRRGSGVHLFELIDQTGDGGPVLFLYINFSVRDRDIRGYIAMLMDLASVSSLKRLIGEFITRVMSDDTAVPDSTTSPDAIRRP